MWDTETVTFSIHLNCIGTCYLLFDNGLHRQKHDARSAGGAEDDRRAAGPDPVRRPASHNSLPAAPHRFSFAGALHIVLHRDGPPAESM